MGIGWIETHIIIEIIYAQAVRSEILSKLIFASCV